MNQAVAVAAMCLHEEASVRPLMSDVVSALSFLGTGPETATSPISMPSPSPDQAMSSITEEPQEEESVIERQRAVAEAIEWGSSSRHNGASRCASTSSF